MDDRPGGSEDVARHSNWQRRPQNPAAVSPEDQERFNFVKVVLADTEDTWTAEFAAHGMQYKLPVMKVYRGQVVTGCGTGTAGMGPFYCPEDRKVYIDLSFYDQLAQTFNSPGDFAQAYVIAHEVGHMCRSCSEPRIRSKREARSSGLQ